MRRKIDFSNLIRELQASGVTYKQIAEDSGVTTGYISHLATGKRKEPSWGLGDYLIRKHAEVFRATP